MNNPLAPSLFLPTTLDEVCDEAIAYHRAGQLEAADQLYRAILQVAPKHPAANYHLGLLNAQSLQAEAALPYLLAALEINPEEADYWLAYIDALLLAGQTDAAREVLTLGQQHGLEGKATEDLAIRLLQNRPDAKPPKSSPTPPTKKSKLAKPSPRKGARPSTKEEDILVTLFNQGRYSEGVELARRMTERFPQHGFGWKFLGTLLKLQSHVDEALAPLQKAAQLLPHDQQAQSNLGVVLAELNRLPEAEIAHRRALAINPHFAEAHCNLGVTLKQQERIAEAEACFRQAITLKSDYAQAHFNLGLILFEQDLFSDAENAFRAALAVKSDYPDAHNSLANALYRQGRLNEAENSYRTALTINAKYTEAYLNLGKTLRELGEGAKAKENYEKLLQFLPDNGEAYFGLGSAELILGHADLAAPYYRRGLELNPDLDNARHALLFTLSLSASIDATTLFAEHCRFGEQFEAPLRASWPQHPNTRDPNRTLQVGFVSGDLYNHALASFIEPVLAQLAHFPTLALHAYHTHTVEDNVTQRLRTYLKHWHSVPSLSAADLAQKIMDDKIDILIDLSGHTDKNRLLTFARKPAPVQASWMGYPGTTGMRAMDYYFTDRYFLPPGQFDDQFTEKLAYLPASAPFLPSESAPPINDLPAVSAGYITFGSFNRLNKVNAVTISLWSKLLRAVPDARMLLGGLPPDLEYDRLIDSFAQEGITCDRLSFHPRSGMDAYLAQHHHVDICLDTYPYAGGTTTYHALWMGVPTLTIAGDTPAGRTGACILGHVGLDACVAQDAADFVQKGMALAKDWAALADVRAALRARCNQSATRQPELIAAHFERALRLMWQRWCQGLPPESFATSRPDAIDAYKASDAASPPTSPALGPKTAHPSHEEENTLVTLFNQKRYSEGFTLARAMTKRYPRHGFGWKVLGALLRSQGNSADALDPLKKSAQLDLQDAQAQSNLGLVLADLNRLPEAEACHRRALAINPHFADAHNNLGTTLRLQGRLTDAEASYQKALAVKPDYAEAQNNLGVTLYEQNRFAEAEAAYLAALLIQPDYAQAYNNLGNTLRKQQRPAEAETVLRRALAYSPDFANAHYNLAIVLLELNRPEEAIDSFRQALTFNPDLAEAHLNLGITLYDLGHLTEAADSFRAALRVNAEYPEAHNNLGNTLWEQGHLPEAEASFRTALSLRPDYAEAHYSLGYTLYKQERLTEAACSFRMALAANPTYVEAYNHLANILCVQGHLNDAKVNYQAALAINPETIEVYINLGSLEETLGQPDLAESYYRRAIAINPDYATAYTSRLFTLSHNASIDAAALFAEHCRFGEQFEAPLRASWPQHPNTRDPDRCLQVGFVSADLYNHAISSFIEPVLAQLAYCPTLALHAYYTHTVEDQATQRLRTYLKHWHSVASLSEADLAQNILDDGIDILIDLSGHSGRNRLLTFARKPAPVQASWMGYPGTTGLQAMDYYFTDRYFLPPGQFDDQFIEKLAYLPASAPFLPSEAAPPVNELPALSAGYITFGSFNRPNKLNAVTISLWSKLLRAVPDARMLLGGLPPDLECDWLIDSFAQEGIASDRISVYRRTGMDAYLAQHHQVDICLDTYPYAGGTTTYHALWMGVPTLTIAGATPAGRSGACILGHVGLDAFVAQDTADFVRKGVFWAKDWAALAEMRAGLRARCNRSATRQPEIIAASFERALRLMWQRWCQGLPAESFEISSRD